MVQIKNDVFCLDISETGAELRNLSIHGVNILWKRSPLWNNQSPILFPIVGQVKDGYYIYNNQSYTIPCHGFIKEQRFNVVNMDSDCIKLSSLYNEATLSMFPFKYEFSITYKLMTNKLRITIEVINKDSKAMYFSCGLHPGFSYEGLNQLFKEQYHIAFSHENVNSVEFTPCLVKSIKEKVIKKTMELSSLSLELMQYKTLCYQNLSSVELRSQTKVLRIENQMPYTAFWQANPTNPLFICIEPWHGLPDDESTTHQLIDKRGIQKLEENKTFLTEIEISYLEVEQ